MTLNQPWFHIVFSHLKVMFCVIFKQKFWFFAGEIRTSVKAGTKFNVTWHLGYPHQGGFRLELLDANEKVIQELTQAGDGKFVLGDTTWVKNPSFGDFGSFENGIFLVNYINRALHYSRVEFIECIFIVSEAVKSLNHQLKNVIYLNKSTCCLNKPRFDTKVPYILGKIVFERVCKSACAFWVWNPGRKCI